MSRPAADTRTAERPEPDVDGALAKLDRSVNRIADERNDLLAALRECIAADDAMAAFLIGADVSVLGREEWRLLHKARSDRRAAAITKARAAIARATGA